MGVIAMTQEKITSLTKYLVSLTDRLNSTVPDKHKSRAKEFKAFLAGEIKAVKEKLEKAKLEGSK